MTRPPAARKPRQKGHVMLEAALCFLPLMALMFGIMDFSFSIFMQSSFQNATREAVRFGITYGLVYNGTTYSSQTLAMTAVAQANAFGFLNATTTLPDGTTGASKIQVNYYFPDNLSTPATAASLPYTTTTTPSYIITNLNQTGNVLEVRVNSYPWNWMVPLPNFMPGKGINLSASSLDVMEGLPVGVFTYPAY
ncbi:MAG TPA: TadE/TadG family type IV pilus assembly protein [Bryobacteraceae bacterium]|jgi:Flp pilus assembly protein TadG